jgi:hypothetical protein
MVKKKDQEEKIYGLKKYFPRLNRIRPGHFEIKYQHPYQIGGYSSVGAFQNMIQSLFEVDFQAFYDSLIKLDRWTQIQTIEGLIVEIKELKSRLISSFTFEGKDYKMFLRPELVRRKESEKDNKKLVLIEVEQFTLVFVEEMEILTGKLLFVKYDIELKGHKVPSKKRGGSFLSFPYIKYSYGLINLKNLREGLVDTRLICECPQKDFDLIFSGKNINAPVKWKGNINELFYFINAINNDTILKVEISQPWILTCKCFTKEDGTYYRPESVRDVRKAPVNAKKIDLLVSKL